MKRSSINQDRVKESEKIDGFGPADPMPVVAAEQIKLRKRRKAWNDRPNNVSILRWIRRADLKRVDAWLFEENLTYAELVDRCRELLNVKLSVSSVHRYYKRERVNHRPLCPSTVPVVRRGNDAKIEPGRGKIGGGGNRPAGKPARP